MTTETVSKITQGTLIPISLVFAIGGGIWSLAVMNTKISNNQLAIAELKAVCSGNPTRDEFNDMKSDIIEIKGDIKKLISTKYGMAN